MNTKIKNKFWISAGPDFGRQQFPGYNDLRNRHFPFTKGQFISE